MKVLAIIKYTFAVVGLCVLIGAFFLYKNTHDFLQNSVSTQGVVLELVRSASSDSTTYAPVVLFEAENGAVVEFTSSVSSNPPSYATGDRVEVLYQTSEPERARIKSFFSLWGAPLILGILGSVFFLVGFSIIVFGFLRKKKAKDLQANGVAIWAKINSVELNTSYSMNGQHPYVIIAQWLNPKTSEIHVFRSDHIWYDPSDHIHSDDIKVLIEKDNPKTYHVDTSFLPKLAD